MAIFKRKELSLLFKVLAVLCAGVLVVLWISFLVLGGESKFDVTYQSVIQRKYEKLENAEGPKIIIVGGSNAGLGIDSDLLEEKTGYTVVNMGLHAGFGKLFNTEIAKGHVNEGDILILAYEYGIYNSDFDVLGDVDLIMSGIDNKLEMYREIPLKNMREVFGNILSFAEYKAQSNPVAAGIYGSDSFDEQGNVIYDRQGCIISDYQNNKDAYGVVRSSVLLAENDEQIYLKKLRSYIEKRGASVYFTSAVLLEDAYEGTEQELRDYAKELEKRTGIPYISDPNDYLFPSEYMYDMIYHCNNVGEKVRTERLAEDLIRSGVVG